MRNYEDENYHTVEGETKLKWRKLFTVINLGV